MKLDENNYITFYQELAILYEPIRANYDKEVNLVPPNGIRYYNKYTVTKEHRCGCIDISWYAESSYLLCRKKEVLLTWFPVENTVRIRRARYDELNISKMDISRWLLMMFRDVPRLC